MNESSQQHHTTGYPARSGILRLCASAALASSVLFVAACANDAPAPPPAQPVAFDHQKHSAIGMSCTQCHPGAETQARAGLTPIAACATCHRGILPDHPEIVKLMGYLDNNESLRWRRVNVIAPAAMVHFKHKPHARAGVECAACHGDVGQMTVARQVVNTANMTWCIACHQDSNASTDCLTCHH